MYLKGTKATHRGFPFSISDPIYTLPGTRYVTHTAACAGCSCQLPKDAQNARLMTKRLIALSAVLSASMAFTAFAQSTDTETQDTEDTPIAPIETDLSLGEDASEPQVGQTYVKEVLQDWELQCIRTEDVATEPCQMYQLLQDENDNPVAEVSLFRLPEGGQAVAGATVIVPLETSLQAQLRISVDGSQGKRYPYSFCNSVGCFARIGLTQDDVNSFKRGAKATLTLVPFLAPDQRVALDMSLKGFTASYDMDRATFTCASRASLGTTSNAHSGSGSS